MLRLKNLSLPLREREQFRTLVKLSWPHWLSLRCDSPSPSDLKPTRRTDLPLPRGEGWGEGKAAARITRIARFRTGARRSAEGPSGFEEFILLSLRLCRGAAKEVFPEPEPAFGKSRQNSARFAAIDRGRNPAPVAGETGPGRATP